MCANLEFYNKVRAVPAEAKKPIAAGRLKGKTDINPMWRLKVLTEEFGMCGVGWKTTIDRTWIDIGANGEQTASVQISLYVKDPVTREWSDAIIGIGGAMYISNEKSGPFTDDECYKKAYTDAISVACKALGIGADVYYEKDSTKYDQRAPLAASAANKAPVTPAANPAVPSGVPFPEAEGFNAAAAQKKDPAELVKPKEDITKARDWAISYKVKEGPRAGMTLGDIYKMDKSAYKALKDNPPDIECAKAITIIDEWISSTKVAK